MSNIIQFNPLRVEVGAFWNIVVLRHVIDKTFPGGSEAFVKKMRCGEITPDFLIWGTMGSDSIIEDVHAAITDLGLNVDESDPQCIYINTFCYHVPKNIRDWLYVETDENNRDYILLKQMDSTRD